MTQNDKENPSLVEQVEMLNEGVKTLAINLAIYLAKAKDATGDLNRMEPEFIRLVNGTVKVVQELATVINAARNAAKAAYDYPSGALRLERLERQLQEISDQCNSILKSLRSRMDLTT